MRTQSRLLFIFFFMLAGCSGMSFPAADHAAPDADARGIPKRFESSTPGHFQLLNSIVFEYNWFTFSGVGFVDINAEQGSYKVACMNHLGVKLFEFEGNRAGLLRQFTIEPLAGKGDIGTVVGTDIQRIYFDLIPSPVARIAKRKDVLIFRQAAGDGTLEYEFSSVDGNLVKKTYREDHRAVWSVSYSEYQRKNDNLYPGNIIFTHYRYGYRLIVKQKEIRG